MPANPHLCCRIYFPTQFLPMQDVVTMVFDTAKIRYEGQHLPKEVFKASFASSNMEHLARMIASVTGEIPRFCDDFVRALFDPSFPEEAREYFTPDRGQ